MKLGAIEGLKFYSQWVKNKKSLNDFIGRNLFERIPTKDALPEMLEMGHVCMQPDFSRDSIRGQDQDLFNAINERAIESEINFQQVRGKYLEWIENYKPNAFVRYYLNDLENRYYTKLGQDRPLTETIKLVDSLLST